MMAEGPTENETAGSDLTVPELTAGARRIVDAAGSLFYRHGIDAVGVDAIALESGISKRTLYDRFGSKDNLVRVCLQVRHHTWWCALQERLTVAPTPRALAVFDAYLDGPLATDRGCGFLNAAADLSPDAPGFPVIRAHKQAVRSCIDELLRTDLAAHPAPHGLTDHLFLLLEGGIAHVGVTGNAAPLRAARTIAADTLHSLTERRPTALG